MDRDHSSDVAGSNVVWSGGEVHWTSRLNNEVRLFLWHKPASPAVPYAGTIFFVHGSSMSSQPTFDLEVAGRPESSAMEWFRNRGFDTWTMDSEGYGRSSKDREINFDCANGVEDLKAGAEYILQRSRSTMLLVYGISSGALKAAMFAQLHPQKVERLALEAFVWTGEGSTTLAERREKLEEWTSKNRRTISRDFILSVFSRDQPGVADRQTVDAFASAILTLDDSMPTGTYVDMCSKLPLVSPQALSMPTMVMRGEFDGIASLDDLIEFFRLLPNPDKQFSVMPGISHGGFQQKNYLIVFHILHAFFSRPANVYQSDKLEASTTR